MLHLCQPKHQIRQPNYVFFDARQCLSQIYSLFWPTIFRPKNVGAYKKLQIWGVTASVTGVGVGVAAASLFWKKNINFENLNIWTYEEEKNEKIGCQIFSLTRVGGGVSPACLRQLVFFQLANTPLDVQHSRKLPEPVSYSCFYLWECGTPFLPPKKLFFGLLPTRQHSVDSNTPENSQSRSVRAYLSQNIYSMHMSIKQMTNKLSAEHRLDSAWHGYDM